MLGSYTPRGAVRVRGTLTAALLSIALIGPAQAAAFDAGTSDFAAGAFAGMAANGLEAFAAAGAPPAGFEESTVLTGMNAPTAIRFAPDGRIFVAEKGGLIKVFDGVGDTTPTIFADLQTQVHDFWDRGLLGMELDPNFASNGRVFVLYTRNEESFSATMPRWPDGCPDPPGATGDGCVVTGTLSRLDSNGAETKLIAKDWCQQYPSHSTGSLAFGADGMLYVSGGDGASFNFADYGQDGNPRNPCGDPSVPVGGVQAPPTAEGGALRSQDVRTTGDSTGLGGSILRVDPETGAAAPGNPNAGSSDPNARRIVAYGFRNPFRITVRPGTNEVWAGDVGWNGWEEINRIANPTAAMTNYGWPCYEGLERQNAYDPLNLNLCESLYAQGPSAIQNPYYTYEHREIVVPGDGCPAGGSSTAGLDFYTSGPFPDSYDGALFFADYTRDCIWVMYRGTNGLPDPSTRQVFLSGAANPVDVQIGPDGALYYVDLNSGTVRRIRWPNSGPTARVSATPTAGLIPLTVDFDGSASSDPDVGDTLSYAWDLDADGAFDDSTAVKPSFTYATSGTRFVRLRVTDRAGATDIATVSVTAGAAPTVTMATPTAGTTWEVGSVITFSGSARDAADQPIPANGLSWTLNLRHCSPLDANNCHTHAIQDFNGPSGSFAAPDHEYPSYLELTLTATDGDGVRTTVSRRLDPRTVNLTFETTPPGLQVAVGSESVTTPATRTVIVGSSNSISAPTPQTLAATQYAFSSWSDGGPTSHNVTAPATNTTYRATYIPQVRSGLVAAYGFDEASGTAVSDASGRGNAGSVNGATRTAAGRFGGALTFDGVNDLVTVPDAASLDMTTGITLEAYVYPTAGGTAWRTAMLKEAGNGLAYALYSNTIFSGRPAAYINVAGDREAVGAAALPLNTWSHLAMTYDGANLRLLVNGAQVSSQALTGSMAVSTGALRIGGNNVWGEWFAGRIDEVRVYERALSATEIQGDMAAAIGPPPEPALTVSPDNLSFTATAGGADPAVRELAVANVTGGSLSFTAAASANWLTVTPGTGSAPASVSVSPRINGLAAGTYTATVTITAPGVAGSPKQIPVTLTVNAPAPPVLSVTPGNLSFTATAGGADPAARNLAVTNTGGGSLSFTASAPPSWLTVSPASGSAPGNISVAPRINGLAAGTYNATVTITAAGASDSPKQVPVTLTVVAAPPPPTGGLVAAFGFNEGAGTAVVDASGRGNAGTISGATWSTAGRFGSALTFDGVNDLVAVADSASLDLTTGMTLEAYVFPTAGGATAWRTAMLKEAGNGLAYALYSNTNFSGRPAGYINVAGDREAVGTAALPLNTWSHLAVTYDGANLRVYVNGTQVASRSQTGSMAVSTGALKFGGNNVWGEWFAGRLDEVRVYNRALNATEIQGDMAAAIGT